MSAAPLLDVQGLSVAFDSLGRRVRVLDDVALGIEQGQILGLVGESGSGKSVTALAIMRLLGEQAEIEAGRIDFEGQNLLDLDAPAMRAVRGRRIAMIFQEPMTSLNPVLTVGFQITEVLTQHLGMGAKAAMRRAAELLDEVGIPDAGRRVQDYPHQLSGGQRQRAMIAMALACEPRLLIADEPTTALDVTIQAQILDLVQKLRERHGMAVLLITHDMGVVAEMADRVAVMYAGQVIEVADAAALFDAPRHPYARLLLRAVPRVRERPARLRTIEGSVPSPAALPRGCRFHPRCPDVLDRCRQEPQALLPLAGRRAARCWRAADA